MKRTYLEFILEGVEDIVGQPWSDFWAVSVSTRGSCWSGLLQRRAAIYDLMMQFEFNVVVLSYRDFCL